MAKYKVFGYGGNLYKISGNNLEGCGPDNNHARSIVVAHDVPKKNQRFLYDADGTYKNNCESWRWAGRDLGEDDWAVIFWSSHGTQSVDLNGDEVDGMDEALCCYDVDWDSQGRVINCMVDDEISEIIDNSVCRWAIFIDACYGEIYDAEKSLKHKSRPRTIHVPEKAQYWINRAKSRGLKSRSVFKGLNRVQVISACRSYQKAADTFLGGEPRGEGSYYFEQYFSKTPEASCVKITCQMRGDMTLHSYSQRPVAQGGLINLPFAEGFTA